jgi:hypothetical protein
MATAALPTSSEAAPALIEPYPWSQWMIGVYRGGKGPQPLGTVIYEEIEEQAKEKLKDYPGLTSCCYIFLKH